MFFHGKTPSIVCAGWLCGILLVSSCSGKEEGLFTSMPSSTTHISFENNLEKKERFNILYYLYYYNGGGVATGDINNDGLPDVFFTANSSGNNKLYLNKGGFEFEDITGKAGVAGNSDWYTGVTIADVNGDGFNDIYVCAIGNSFGLNGRNELFINNGNGSFTERAPEYGLDFSGLSTQAAFFDYDHDGDLDCYLLNQSKQPHANIIDTSNRRGIDPLSGDRLYRNELNTGQKKFTDVSREAGIYQSKLGYGLGLAISDLNNDGWEDVYVGNDFHENDYYYVNNGNGTFTESGSKHFRHYSRFSMGNDIADYNNDGQPDIVTVDMLPPDEKTLKTYGSDENPDVYKVKLEMNGYQHQFSRNCLQRNNGNGESFSDLGLAAGISATDWSWSPLLADFDNDGNKDLFISSGIVKRPVDLDYIRFVSDLERNKGMNRTDAYDDQAIEAMPDGSSHPFFFTGDGQMAFREVSKEWGTASMKGYFNGAAYADLDNDGDLDLLINSLNAKATVLRNNTANKNFLNLSFKGTGMNRSGIGARVYLYTSKGLQYQQLMPTRGFQSASDLRLHFGLASDAVIDSLLVVWPDQRCQLLKQVKPAQFLVIDHSAAKDKFDYNKWFPATALPLVPNGQSTSWVHHENNFFDHNVQYLIPHGQSTRGPRIAVADVNGDGLEDMYACGALEQAGALLIQRPDGSFVNADTAVFNPTAFSEDVDALFFDANNDGQPDLYVVSGGNQYEDGDPRLADRLYLNKGNGHFELSASPIPTQLTNKSSVTAADVDKDGDIDLFVGGLANSRQYGIASSSWLLLNDGRGNFSLAPISMIDAGQLGMVTTVASADFDKDGWPDLIAAGEWMELTLYMNRKGKFMKQAVTGSTGLWQSLYPADVNGDGYMDILAGNWGKNSKLWAGKNGPLKLYVKDFDKNGSIEQVMAYTIDGKEYPFLAKDELERALPVLKKAYLTYGEVAGKTVDYIFYDLFKDYKELKAETLTSTCFLNDGKGGFQQLALPDALQLAPLMCFANLAPVGGTGFLAAGNFFNVTPYEGRYDALQPTFFSYDPKARQWRVNGTLPGIAGETRDLKWIRGKAGHHSLALARNNTPIVFLEQKTN
ncbi:VCBS repeat-containing protein [Flavihumibacter rivuli]|uniref:VCBS repeat-containing protein n=1 Tax=Flavihumibacter rivuli TaxID=2838156 RepID=UPI001BDF20AB|nr:VCBS repeat-containing protein [Flavihumibacter rivuli]ULQ56020.1 VCBS repeat-containing protein [Flavihumibacter rivuli]